MMAPKRALEQNSRGNWVSRYDAGRKADHYARAEVYCMLAGKPGHHADGKFLRPRLIDLKPRRGGARDGSGGSPEPRGTLA